MFFLSLVTTKASAPNALASASVWRPLDIFPRIQENIPLFGDDDKATVLHPSAFENWIPKCPSPPIPIYPGSGMSILAWRSKKENDYGILSLLLWPLLPSATKDCQERRSKLSCWRWLDYLNTVMPAHKRGAATSEDNLSGILNANLAFTMTYCKST